MWCRVVQGGAGWCCGGANALHSDQFAASKIICKCQSILTVCGDVFQITIYNSQRQQQRQRQRQQAKRQKVKPEKSGI